MRPLTSDLLLAELSQAAGADARRLAGCPPLPGRWSSTGLSAVLAAQVMAGSIGLAERFLGTDSGYPTWGLVSGLLAYVGALRVLWHGLPRLLQQFDRPGPDRLAARWAVAGLVVSAVIGLALLLAVPYEIFLTGPYAAHGWADWQEPTALLRWAVRGVVLAALAVPLVARRGLARSAAYGTLCNADYQLRLLTAARATATL